MSRRSLVTNGNGSSGSESKDKKSELRSLHVGVVHQRAQFKTFAAAGLPTRTTPLSLRVPTHVPHVDVKLLDSKHHTVLNLKSFSDSTLLRRGFFSDSNKAKTASASLDKFKSLHKHPVQKNDMSWAALVVAGLVTVYGLYKGLDFVEFFGLFKAEKKDDGVIVIDNDVGKDADVKTAGPNVRVEKNSVEGNLTVTQGIDFPRPK